MADLEKTELFNDLQEHLDEIEQLVVDSELIGDDISEILDSLERIKTATSTSGAG